MAGYWNWMSIYVGTVWTAQRILLVEKKIVELKGKPSFKILMITLLLLCKTEYPYIGEEL